MNTKVNLLAMTSIIALLAIMIVPNSAVAETNQNEISINPINEKISLETTITTLTVPEDNTLPWGTVHGAASDVAERYPVIIQFYKGDEAIHMAQVDTKGDGSYEYKFRVNDIDHNTGESIKVFEGEYTVKIFKVIPNINPVV